MRTRIGAAFGAVAWLCLLAACGGGGGNDSSPLPLLNAPPASNGGNGPTAADGSGTTPTANQGKSGPKALVIEIDGLTHAALRDAIAQNKAPALQSLRIAPAWTGGTNGTSSEQLTTEAPGWATLLTGTWAQRHGVRWDTADQRIDAKLSPSVFAFAKQKKDADYKTASITATPLYASLLSSETGTLDSAIDCAGADACVTERTAQLIDAGYDLLVAQYGAPVSAARNGLKSDAYQRAVADTSAAVGQLLARIAQRTANDAKEDWLVIVTTGYGLDEFGSASGTQFIGNKTVFIASNKALMALPGADNAAPADTALLQLAAATDIAPTVLRHLNALAAPEAYNFNGQALQAATSLRELSAEAGADKASIELSWTLSGGTTAPVQVLRNGKLVATLPAGATAYADPIVADVERVYTFPYTVVAGEASVAITARLAYVKPVPLEPTLAIGLVNYYPLDTLPAVDFFESASTLAPWAADADGGSVVDDGFLGPRKAGALRVDSKVKNASGLAGYRLLQTTDVATNAAVAAFTIGFWLRTDPTCSQGVDNGASVIANKNYTSGVNEGLAIGLFGSCEIQFNAGTGPGGTRADSQGYNLSAGQWAYLAVVIDKANPQLTGYLFDPVRGKQTEKQDLTSALIADLGGLKNGIGLNEDGTGRYYQREAPKSPRGAMDFNDFAIWNRALTDAELTSIFKSGKPLSTLTR